MHPKLNEKASTQRFEFKDKTSQFTGRNGTGICSGIEVYKSVIGENVTIIPITSKGKLANCTITIPDEEVKNLVKTLNQTFKDAPLITHLQAIPVSKLIPANWGPWFYTLISENAPFSWGDNNNSLISLSRFETHCHNRLDFQDEKNPPTTKELVDQFFYELTTLPQTTLIDLEN